MRSAFPIFVTACRQVSSDRLDTRGTTARRQKALDGNQNGKGQGTATIAWDIIAPAQVPAADYVPWLISGSLLFISGQIARDGDQFICGQASSEQDLERAQYAARACGIALLAQARDALAGELDRTSRVIRIGGFVNAAPEFEQHASVMNGCSKLMIQVFEEKGRHVRAAVGCSSLPREVMVEAEAVFELLG